MGMIGQMCAFYNNYFDRDGNCNSLPKYYGSITISGGQLVGFGDKLRNGQYFRIVGSLFNDGVYKFPATGLTDETFEDGAVWAMAVPRDFLDFVKQVEDWQTKYNGADSNTHSPFNSESFGGYSYSKSTGGTSGGYDTNSWQGAFASEHNKWKKVRI